MIDATGVTSFQVINKISFFLGKVDNGKFPKLRIQNMELLALDTVETNTGQNTTGIGTSILADNQPERVIKKVNERQIDMKDIEDKEVNNVIGKCKHQA